MCDYLAVRRSLAIAAAAACLVIVPGAKAVAEAGFYAGGSLGSATVKADFPDAENIDEVFEFDEDDLGWKAFGGYNFGLDFLALAIEAGYVDLGKPSGTFLDNELEVDVTGLDVFGLAGLQLGPIGVFAKAGVISWDIEATIDGIEAGDDDGTDPAYGVGARFNLGSFEIRGEYEMFDLDNVDDVYMLSAGLVWTF
jgi:outer membrane immunogenic protein